MANRNGSKWIRPAKRAAIYARDGHACVYCGCDLSGQVATLDHVTPREFGGSNKASNLVTACQSCNSAKQDKPVAEFVRYLTEQGIDAADIPRRVRNATRRNWRLYTNTAAKAA